MVSPANLFRMMTEMIFVLLGGLLVFLGLSHRFAFNPRSPAWLGLGAVLVYWGARALTKTTRAARTADRMVARVSGISLVLVGFLMLGLVALDPNWKGLVLSVAGAILALRGLAGAILSLRTD